MLTFSRFLKESKSVSLPVSEFKKEHEHLVNILRDGTEAEREKEAKDQAKELDNIKEGHLSGKMESWGFLHPSGKHLTPEISDDRHEDLAKRHGFKDSSDAVKGGYISYRTRSRITGYTAPSDHPHVMNTIIHHLKNDLHASTSHLIRVDTPSGSRDYDGAKDAINNLSRKRMAATA